jgi:hypothetical protein
VHEKAEFSFFYLRHDDGDVENTNGKALAATILLGCKLRSNSPWNTEQHLQEQNIKHNLQMKRFEKIDVLQLD